MIGTRHRQGLRRLTDQSDIHLDRVLQTLKLLASQLEHDCTAAWLIYDNGCVNCLLLRAHSVVAITLKYLGTEISISLRFSRNRPGQHTGVNSFTVAFLTALQPHFSPPILFTRRQNMSLCGGPRYDHTRLNQFLILVVASPTTCFCPSNRMKSCASFSATSSFTSTSGFLARILSESSIP